MPLFSFFEEGRVEIFVCLVKRPKLFSLSPSLEVRVVQSLWPSRHSISKKKNKEGSLNGNRTFLSHTCRPKNDKRIFSLPLTDSFRLLEAIFVNFYLQCLLVNLNLFPTSLAYSSDSGKEKSDSKRRDEAYSQIPFDFPFRSSDTSRILLFLILILPLLHIQSPWEKESTTTHMQSFPFSSCERNNDDADLKSTQDLRSGQWKKESRKE